jgi:hypothetical protein
MSDQGSMPPPPPPSGGGGYGGTPPPGGGYGGPPPGGGYGAPPPPGGDYGYGYGAVPVGTNSKAIWSLVLGILGLLCCGFFAGIPAIILGRMAQGEIARTGQQGKGLATAGFILGIVACVLGVISAILFATGSIDFSGSTSP